MESPTQRETWYTGCTISNGHCGYHALAEVFVRVFLDDPNNINPEFFNENNEFFKPARECIKNYLNPIHVKRPINLKADLSERLNQNLPTTKDIACHIAPALFLINIKMLNMLENSSQRDTLLEKAWGNNLTREEQKYLESPIEVVATLASSGTDTSYLERLSKDTLKDSIDLSQGTVKDYYMDVFKHSFATNTHTDVEIEYIQLLAKILFKPIQHQNTLHDRVFVGRQQDMATDSHPDAMKYAVIMPQHSENETERHFIYAVHASVKDTRPPFVATSGYEATLSFKKNTAESFTVQPSFKTDGLSDDDNNSFGFNYPPSNGGLSSNASLSPSERSPLNSAPASPSESSSNTSIAATTNNSTATDTTTAATLSGSTTATDAVTELFDSFSRDPTSYEKINNTQYTVGRLILKNTSTPNQPSITIEQKHGGPETHASDEQQALKSCFDCFKNPQVDITFTISCKKDIERLRDFVASMPDSPEAVFNFNLTNEDVTGKIAVSFLIPNLTSPPKNKSGIVAALQETITHYPHPQAQSLSKGSAVNTSPSTKKKNRGPGGEIVSLC